MQISFFHLLQHIFFDFRWILIWSLKYRPPLNYAYLRAFDAARLLQMTRGFGWPFFGGIWRALYRHASFLMSREKIGMKWRAFDALRKFQNFAPFSKFWTIIQNFDHFSKFWPIFKILTSFQNFDQFSKFWQIFKILTNFKNFCPF